MTFVEAIKSAFNNYVNFKGRATRSEYWWFMLFQILVLAIPYLLLIGEASRGQAGIGTALYWLIALGLFLPGLGLSFRRLHDTNRSAWWLLIGLIPLIGGILLLVWTILKGTDGPNKYGEDKLRPDVVSTFE
ncbi:DUF805 domain-containing protein [Asticcacaulis tiandongensis]|uniref:DUF805 domain-containing protein n=1 Tax=Asticcacaulis tiandongensis TaxID=2565365 RepID=UPI00112C10DC|nr:DUF805 domain-containing protein [Asticcacaulis tiandongensis]